MSISSTRSYRPLSLDDWHRKRAAERKQRLFWQRLRTAALVVIAISMVALLVVLPTIAEAR